jgi:hypothetical protein
MHDDDPFEGFNCQEFLEALDPNNWTQESTTLYTPTFAARLAEGQLLIAKHDRQLELDASELLALARFLTKYVTLPPEEPPADLKDFKPTRMDTQEGGEEP